MLADYLKHLVIQTRLEPLAHHVRDLMPRRDVVSRMLHAEEQAVQRTMRQLIAPDFCCADVGAHLGAMLSRMLRHAPHGRHFAFEALPHKAAWLRAKFPQVAVHEVALSREPGERVFYFNRDASGFSGLVPARNGVHKKITVATATLDGVLEDADRLDFVKIDVEGAELDVLQGGCATLGRCRPFILFECAFGSNRRHGRMPADVHAYLTDTLGYAIYLPADYLSGKPPISRARFNEASVYPPIGYNFLAVPDGRPAI